MKILQITAQAPGKRSGGELGVLQTTMSITDNRNIVDYVGPEIPDKNICSLYRNTFILKSEGFSIRRITNLLRGITNSRYIAWKKLILDIDSYDVIVMDFAKLDYVLKRIKGKFLVVKEHNVEFDYSRNDFKKNGGFNKYIVHLFSRKQEANILKRANVILVLTECDKKRLAELYGRNILSKIKNNPVCILDHNFDLHKKNNCMQMLITGSFWYGDNVEGAIWFIEKVFSKLNFTKKLVIAGSRPNEKIKSVCSLNNEIELIDSPDEMEPFFKQCDIVITPVFSGAGMKVKVAEALSYGKPVIGTEHALVGYDFENGKDLFLAKDEQEFIDSIYLINEMNDDNYLKLCLNARELYKKKYSINASSLVWKEAIEMRKK